VLTNTANGLAKGARDSGNKVCRLTQLQHLKKDGAHSSVTSVQPYLSQIKQQLSQLLLARKVTVSLNFGDRSYGGILRPPAVLMFYDFAPHGDGANNNNPIGAGDKYSPSRLGAAAGQMRPDQRDREHRYNFHLLRHTASLFITYLRWPPKRIQTVMGHASVRITFDLYGRLFESVEADREDMKKLEAAVRAA
jgi:hypothetical protein